MYLLVFKSSSPHHWVLDVKPHNKNCVLKYNTLTSSTLGLKKVMTSNLQLLNRLLMTKEPINLADQNYI